VTSRSGRPRLHLFVCVNQRPPGNPKGCCADKGSEQLRTLLKEACAKLDGTVQVTRALCLGECERGANIVVYPDNIWYCGVTSADIAEIVHEHVVGGRPVKRLLNPMKHQREG
jgi:(2Fe-2S) ferredoxin